MNKQIRQILSVVVILLVLIGLGAGSSYLAENSPKASTVRKSVDTISYQGQDGKSVLDILKETHQVETVDTDFGVFVKTIDGVTQTDNSVWLYYINGEPGIEGANAAKTTNGQTIEWRYESF